MLMLRENEKPEEIKPGQNCVGKRCAAIVLGFDDLRQENFEWLKDCAMTRVTGEATLELLKSMPPVEP